jgi:hypothetical protein
MMVASLFVIPTAEKFPCASLARNADSRLRSRGRLCEFPRGPGWVRARFFLGVHIGDGWHIRVGGEG